MEKKKNPSAKGPQCYFSLDRGEAEIFTACCLEIQAVRRGKNLLAVSLRGSKPWLGPERAAPRALRGLLRCDGELGGGLRAGVVGGKNLKREISWKQGCALLSGMCSHVCPFQLHPQGFLPPGCFRTPDSLPRAPSIQQLPGARCLGGNLAVILHRLPLHFMFLLHQLMNEIRQRRPSSAQLCKMGDVGWFWVAFPHLSCQLVLKSQWLPSRD